VTSPAFLRFILSVDDTSYDRAAAALLELPTPGWQEADDGATLVFWLAADMVDDPSLQEALAELRELGRLRAVPERADWLTYWKRFHHAVRVGAVTVRPPWLPADPDTLDVVVDVGLAFGTGSHTTTRQCLAALQEVGPGSLLDIGTGSGVLSLAALRLGFAPVHGCDVDELALRAAHKNARLNSLSPQLFVADVGDPEVQLPPTDVAVVNVALNPIVAYGKRLQGEQEGARPRDVLLAGLLETQADEARAAYPGYAERRRAQEDEWVFLHLERCP
jgi:ribosomal protein L11 methyltransferase